MGKDWQKEAEHWQGRYTRTKDEMSKPIDSLKKHVAHETKRADASERAQRDLTSTNAGLRRQVEDLQTIVNAAGLTSRPSDGGDW